MGKWIFLLFLISAQTAADKLIGPERLGSLSSDMRASRIFHDFFWHDLVMLAEVVQIEKGGESAPFWEFSYAKSPDFLKVEPKRIWKGNPSKMMDLAIGPQRPALEPGKTYLFFVDTKRTIGEHDAYFVKDPSRRSILFGMVNHLDWWRIPELIEAMDEVVKPGLTREEAIKGFRAFGLKKFPAVAARIFREDRQGKWDDLTIWPSILAVPPDEAIRIVDEIVECTKGKFMAPKCDGYKRVGASLEEKHRERFLLGLKQRNERAMDPKWWEIPSEEMLQKKYGPKVLEGFPLPKGIEVRP